MNDRLDELWTDYLEGELENSGLTELDALLSRDEARVRQVCDDYQQHRLLGRLHAEGPADRDRFVKRTLERLAAGHDEFTRATLSRLDPGARPRILRWAIPSLAAAAAIVFAAILWPRGGDSEVPPVIASLILSEDCVWADDTSVTDEGRALHPGFLTLQKGNAVIRFTGGAEMVMSGETQLELLSASRARLAHGEVVIRADEGAEGFVLETPASELVDLGTEFVVWVDRGGATRMQVHEGLVSADGELVEAGQAIRFEGGGSKVGRKVAGDPQAPRFSEMLRRANPRARPDLMRVYEGFDLPAGNYNLDELDGGKGWSGPWRLPEADEKTDGYHAAASPNVTVVHGRLDIPWPVRGGRKGALELGAGRQTKIRPLAESINLAGEQVTFLSFMVATPERGSTVDLTLRSSERFWGGKLGFGWTSSGRPIVRTGGGSISRGTRSIPEGGTIFCVARIRSRADAPDELSLRCYHPSDSLPFLETADWDVESHQVDLSGRFDLLEVTTEGSSPVWLDELRIGPTWRSVAPIRDNEP